MGGSSEHAPAAIVNLFNLVHARIPQATLSGIIGDSSHTYGYHRAAAYVPTNDYSRQFPEDRDGIDAYAACALDISLPPDLMRTVSHRLMVAGRANDPRLAALREWFGTENGTVVTGWDRRSPRTPSDDCYTSSDDSHLWHVHLSIYRSLANNAAALAPIADVIAGVDTEDDMTPEQDALLRKIAAAITLDQTHPSTPSLGSLYKMVKDFRADATHSNTIPGILKAVAEVSAEVAALRAALGQASGGAVDMAAVQAAAKAGASEALHEVSLKVVAA